MEIISRAEAKRNGQKTYFTGESCKNGHIAYRYTQSGTCAKCINSDHKGATDPTAAARREAKTQLVQVQIRIYDEDRESIAAAVWAMGIMRFPVLTQGDVDPRLLPRHRAAGTGIYCFNCHVDDVAAVRELGAGSISARRLDVEAARAAALKAAGGSL